MRKNSGSHDPARPDPSGCDPVFADHRGADGRHQLHAVLAHERIPPDRAPHLMLDESPNNRIGGPMLVRTY
jgi:hypothetical protein